jgi:hypothetical protein
MIAELVGKWAAVVEQVLRRAPDRDDGGRLLQRDAFPVKAKRLVRTLALLAG